MRELQTYQMLQAFDERHAVQRTTRRHLHLSTQPLVVVGYHLAGDLGAPLALLWGSDRTVRPQCMVVPEPRNRGERFAALAKFADGLLAYLARFGGRDASGSCVDAPQIVVPNLATAAWLFGIVGRFTRSLPTDGDNPVPLSVPLAGKHLSFFADRLPGSSLALAATEALVTHWQTGQLPSEDLNLAALLGWIDPPPGLDGPQAARLGEATNPAGPDSDPTWDAEVLEGLIKSWHASEHEPDEPTARKEIEDELRARLRPAWNDCWRALDLLNTLPAADHVARRWGLDRVSWTGHSTRIAEDRAHFRNIPTPIQAARRLRLLEDRSSDLERQMAWDDPLVMAGAIASGEALTGRVAVVDPDRRSPNAAGKNVLRPLITIEPSFPFARPAGTTLYLATHPNVTLELLPADAQGRIPAMVVAGANMKTTIGRLPNLGDNVVLSPYGTRDLYQRSDLDDIPWTHQEISAAEPGSS